MPSLFDRPVNKSNALRNGALSYALERKPTLGERLRAFANVAGEDESAGAGDYRDKVVTLETLHLLDEVDPKRYKEIYNAAVGDGQTFTLSDDAKKLLELIAAQGNAESSSPSPSMLQRINPRFNMGSKQFYANIPGTPLSVSGSPFGNKNVRISGRVLF